MLRLSAASLSCAWPPCQVTAVPLPARCRQPALTQASPPRWTQARSGCRKPAAFGFCSLQLPGLEEPASSGTPHCPSPACVPRSGVSDSPRVSWLLTPPPRTNDAELRLQNTSRGTGSRSWIPVVTRPRGVLQRPSRSNINLQWAWSSSWFPHRPSLRTMTKSGRSFFPHHDHLPTPGLALSPAEGSGARNPWPGCWGENQTPRFVLSGMHRRRRCFALKVLTGEFANCLP